MKTLTTTLSLLSALAIGIPSLQAEKKDTPSPKSEAKSEAKASANASAKTQTKTEVKQEKSSRPKDPEAEIASTKASTPRQPAIKLEERPGRNVQRTETKPNARPEAPKRTWLGIATSAVAPSLREHLELEEGFGIQIQEVIGNSPAETAGLKSHDILLKYEEQLLISPEHLSLLVRREDSGKKVSLTVIRKGHEETLHATLGSSSNPHLARPMPPQLPNHQGSNTRDPHQWHESVRRQQDYWQKWMEKKVEEKDGNDQAGANRPPSISVRPGFPVNIFGAAGVLKIDNDEGEVTLTLKDGEHLIEIRDEKGKLIHEGEIDLNQGVEGLPQKARDHLKEMKLDDFKALSFSVKKPAPKKISLPRDPKVGNAANSDKPL